MGGLLLWLEFPFLLLQWWAMTLSVCVFTIIQWRKEKSFIKNTYIRPSCSKSSCNPVWTGGQYFTELELARGRTFILSAVHPLSSLFWCSLPYSSCSLQDSYNNENMNRHTRLVPLFSKWPQTFLSSISQESCIFGRPLMLLSVCACYVCKLGSDYLDLAAASSNGKRINFICKRKFVKMIDAQD